MRSIFVAMMLLCSWNSLQAAELKPIKTEAEIKVCAGSSTFLSEKGVCYIFDIVTKEKRVEVAIAGGLNLSAGNILLGGQVKGVIEVRIIFPVGHSKEEMLKVAEKEFEKALKSKALKKKLKALEADKITFGKLKETRECTEDDPLGEKLKKAVPWEK